MSETATISLPKIGDPAPDFTAVTTHGEIKFSTWADKSWVVLPGGDHAAFLETPRPYFLSTLESFLLRGGM